MSSSIIDNVTSFLGPRVSGVLASQMGESPEAIRRGLLGGVPSLPTSFPSQTAAITNKWLWPVVILAALLLGGLWFLNRNKMPVKETMQSAVDAASSTMSALASSSRTNYLTVSS